MTLSFATMSVALAVLRFGSRGVAITAAFACLVVSAGLFLFEIHDAESGFGMPWLRL